MGLFDGVAIEEQEEEQAAKPLSQMFAEVEESLEGSVGVDAKRTQARKESIFRGVTFGLSRSLADPVEQAEQEARQDTLTTAEQLGYEVLGSIPTGLGLSSALTKAGIKSATMQGGIEGLLYGVGNDDPEMALMGGVMGAGAGKIVDTVVGSYFNRAQNAASDVAPDDIPEQFVVERIVPEDAPVDDKALVEAVENLVNRTNVTANREPIDRWLEFNEVQDAADKMTDSEFDTFLNKKIRENSKGVNTKEGKNAVRERFEGYASGETPVAEQFSTYLLSSTKQVAQDFGVSTSDVMKALSKNGGMKVADNLADMSQILPMNLRRNADGAVVDKGSWFNRFMSPVRRLAKDTVGDRYAGLLNRGAIGAQAQGKQVDDLFQRNGMDAVREAADKDELLNRALVDYGNPELTAVQRTQARQIIDAKLGDDVKNSFYRFIDEQEELLDSFAPHTQTYQRSKGYLSVARETDNTPKNLRDQARSERLDTVGGTQDQQSKAKMKQSALEVNEETGEYLTPKYDNVIDTHYNWMQGTNMEANVNKVFGIRGAATADEMAKRQSGTWAIDQLEKEMKRQGYKDAQIQNAIQIYRDVVYGSQKGMSKELQGLRNIGYASTIANPYGALMNIHDLFNAAWDKGVGNMLESLFSSNGFKMTAEDVGLARQVFGEYVKRSRGSDAESWTNLGFTEAFAQNTQKMLDWSMSYSGFRKLDSWTKTKIMKAGVGKNIAEVKANTAQWRKKWANTFEEYELDSLERALKSGDLDNPYVKELAMIELSDLQPISAASQTQAGLNKPNLRILYMLKGFAIKQLDLLRRRVFDEYRNGNKKKAMQNALSYLLISGGGYGVVQEGRQPVKGEMPDITNIPELALYQVFSVLTGGAFGANQYGAHVFMQDPAKAFLENVTPPTGLIGGVGKDLAQGAKGTDFVPNETLKQMPLIGPVARAVETALE